MKDKKRTLEMGNLEYFGVLDIVDEEMTFLVVKCGKDQNYDVT